MKTTKIKQVEDLDTREVAQRNHAIMPVSYYLDMSGSTLSIKSKNISGQDIPEGLEDVHPYFIYK